MGHIIQGVSQNVVPMTIHLKKRSCVYLGVKGRIRGEMAMFTIHGDLVDLAYSSVPGQTL